MSVTLSPWAALAVLFASLLVVTTGSIAITGSAGVDGEPNPVPQYVELDDGTVLWPYHSQSPEHATRTLPINVVIYGDTTATERLLREGGVGEWEELPEDQQDIDPEEAADAIDETARWGGASGATRYVYFEPKDGGTPRWTSADYQIHNGDYLGSRHHIRAYADPAEGNWTVIQAHREHWDWFRLRHTVHSTAASQRYVEEQFLHRWYVVDVHREHFDNDRGSDADGWVTVIELPDWLTLTTGIFLGCSVGAAARRFGFPPESGDTAARSALLAGAVAAPYLFVRFASIAVERMFPWLGPKLIIVLFHPVLVVGVPVAVYFAARPLDMIRAFAIASLAFLIALFLDYTFLGIRVLPLHMFLYHVVVAAAVGFIAAGASRPARSPETAVGHVRTGVLLWIAIGLLPLLRFVDLV